MSEQPEATELAELLDSYRMISGDARVLAAAELRRQREEIETLKAQRDALLDALEEIHQATMKNKVVIAKYVGISFLAAIAIRKAKEGK